MKTRTSLLSIFFKTLALVVLLCAVHSSAFGQAGTRTWDGDTSSDFGDGNNWVGGIAPSSASGVSGWYAEFSGPSSVFQPVISATRALYGLRFTTSGGGWTLGNSGVLLSIGAGGINTIGQSSGTTTININLNGSADQNMSAGTDSTLQINGDLGLDVVSWGTATTGAGTIVMNGARTVTVNSFINAGTLLITGNASGGSGTLTATSGTKVGGSGSYGGRITVRSGAIFDPTGNFTILGKAADTSENTLAFGSTGVAAFTLSSSNSDSITIDNTVGISNVSLISGASITLSLTYAPTVGDTFTLINNLTAGTFVDSGTFANILPNGIITADYLGTTYSFKANNYGGAVNDLILTNVVPEPGTWALFAVGVIIVLLRKPRTVSFI